jgi:hypothetical protein
VLPKISKIGIFYHECGNAAVQADLNFGKHKESRLVQALKSGHMESDFAVGSAPVIYGACTCTVRNHKD